MSRKYSQFIPSGGVLLDIYKDKSGVLILHYTDPSLGRWIFIDPFYRKKNRLSENQKSYKFDYLGGTSNYYETNEFSMDLNYRDCLWGLRKNKRARRWFRKIVKKYFKREGIIE